MNEKWTHTSREATYSNRKPQSETLEEQIHHQYSEKNYPTYIGKEISVLFCKIISSLTLETKCNN